MMKSDLEPHARTPSPRAGTKDYPSCANDGVSDISMARRLGSSVGTNRHTKSSLVAGRYEEAALPDYGIDRLHVTLDPVLLHSYLTVKNIDVYTRFGGVRVAFDCPRPIGPASRSKNGRVTAPLRSVSDQQFELEQPVRAFGIRALVVVGDRLLTTDIWLVDLLVRSTDLVLGSTAFDDIMQIDAGESFILGRPRHRYMDLLRNRSRAFGLMAATAVPVGPSCPI